MSTSSVESDPDTHWMRQALALARGALYVPAPNPRVGCVIVRDGQLLAQGATRAAGQAHAEVVALEQLALARASAQGATVYVTLEPCSHTGRTAPCVEALIAAAPERVVIAHVDPNPKVATRGIQALRAAGIVVDVGVCAQEALEINPGFIFRTLLGRPYVWLKIAASLDAHTTTASGESQWITGAQARADGHHWRARSCVVLTGIGTVKADDPMLNVREVTTARQPLRAVIDARLEICTQARLLASPGLLVFTTTSNPEKTQQLRDLGAQVVCLPDSNNPSRVDLLEVMRWLAQHEINEVHVEAGAGLNGALWQANCVDELLVYLAPMLLGGGAPMLQGEPVATLAQARRLRFLDSTVVGDDVRLRLQVPQRWDDVTSRIQQANAESISPH